MRVRREAEAVRKILKSMGVAFLRERAACELWAALRESRGGGLLRQSRGAGFSKTELLSFNSYLC